jgi:hypothetical protein
MVEGNFEDLIKSSNPPVSNPHTKTNINFITPTPDFYHLAKRKTAVTFMSDKKVFYSNVFDLQIFTFDKPCVGKLLP